MRRLLGLLVGACAFTAGFAVADAERSDPSDAVRTTLRRAIVEATAGSPTRACRYATATGRARMIYWYSYSYDRRFRSCEEILRFERRTDAANVRSVRRGHIGRITMRGRRAVAVVYNEGGDSAYVHLRRLDGHWRVDNSNVLPAGH
jgi:hypothetical protein